MGLLPTSWSFSFFHLHGKFPAVAVGSQFLLSSQGRQGNSFSLLMPEPSWASSWAALLGVRNLAENPGHHPLWPSSTSSACSLLPSWPVSERAVPSSPLSGPCSWVALLVLGCKRHGSFREGVPAVLRDQVPTHVSKCHQWEPRHCNPAHNAPLKTFQQLN